MPGAVGHRQEQIGRRYGIEVEAGPQDDVTENHNGENLDGREQPVKWDDPDDPMPGEDQPGAGVIDEAARGNHHHESTDDEKDIDPRRAVFSIYAGRRGIDARAPCLEGVEKDDEQCRDGAERLNGQEV
jgi:hypothetical protein